MANASPIDLWKISLTTSKEAASIFADTLEEWALAVSFYETENEDVWHVVATWEGKPDFPFVENLIKNAALLLEVSVPLIESESIEEQDWLTLSYQAFPPLLIGPFYIHGSHLAPDLQPNQIALQIDAATAFGTGEHQTTRACLELILKEDLSTKSRAIDVGCGSGILAMAVAKLAEQRGRGLEVWACDNDPESVKVCQQNLKDNNVDSLVTALLSDGLNNPQLQNATPFDLIIANILANPLCEMAPSLTSNLKIGGTIILSGLLTTQADEVAKAYTDLGLQLVETLELQEWSALKLMNS